MYIYIRIHKHIYTHIHVYIYVYVYVSTYVYIYIYVNIYTYTLHSKHIPQIVGKDHKLADEDVSSYKDPYISAKETYIPVPTQIPIFPQESLLQKYKDHYISAKETYIPVHTKIPVFPQKRPTFLFIQRSPYFRKRVLHSRPRALYFYKRA